MTGIHNTTVVTFIHNTRIVTGIHIARVVMKSIILGIHSKNDPYILELTKINNFHNGNFSPRGLFNRPTGPFMSYALAAGGCD